MHETPESSPAPPLEATRAGEQTGAIPLSLEAFRARLGQAAGEAPKRVAVVAVHGVGYHEPGASARAVQDVLLAPAGQGRARAVYSAFQERWRHIGLAPVPAPPPRAASGDWRERRAEPSTRFAARLRQTREAPGNVGLRYSELLLRDYAGGAEGNECRLLRLEGQAQRGAAASDVHIYDGLWADLARPTNSVLSFLLAVVQLTVHLAGLSQEALHSVASLFPGRLWRLVMFFQRLAVRTLQLPLVLLNVMLLVTLLASFALWPHGAALKMAALGSVLVLLSAAVYAAYVLLPKGPRVPLATPALLRDHLWWRWLLAPLLLLLGLGGWRALGHSLALRAPGDGAWPALLAVVLWLAGAALVYLVVKLYAPVRPGAAAAAWTLYLASSALLAAELGRAHGEVAPALLETLRWQMSAAKLCAAVLVGAAIGAFALGVVARWRTRGGLAPVARAALRTSRLTLAVPVLLLVILLSAGWVSVFALLNKAHLPLLTASVPVHRVADGSWQRMRQFADPFTLTSTAASRLAPHATTLTFSTWLNTHALTWAFLNSYELRLALLLLCVLFVVPWLLPSLLSEGFPPRGAAAPPRSPDTATSQRMGRWFSRGVSDAALATTLLWSAAFLVPALPLVTALLGRGTSAAGVAGHTAALIKVLEAAAAFLLSVALRQMSAGLDIVLDVDRYLRTTPGEATTRARIFERFVSLLRHVAEEGYDEVLIVAHSLGSVIVTDLLQYLHAHPDPALASLGLGPESGAAATPLVSPTPSTPTTPLTLVTLGSPLRQLLNRFFPALYFWVRPEPDNVLAPAAAGNSTRTALAATPEPAPLGLAGWVNVYRSADYVGRGLWSEEAYTPGALVASGAGPLRADVCLGAGAHLHYLDDTAPDVGLLLDALLTRGTDTGRRAARA